MPDNMREILSHIHEHQEVIEKLLNDTELLQRISRAADVSKAAIAKGKKILFCGNGGSAADAQHFAAELVVRLEGDRPSLPAIALTTDSSILTAIGNDYSFEDIFSRQIASLGDSGDVLICLTTSGNSPNIIKAAKAAMEKGIQVIALTGMSGGEISTCSDILINVPSSRTMRIQEAHSVVLHIWCKIAEQQDLRI